MYRNYSTEEFCDLKDLLNRSALRYSEKPLFWEKKNGVYKSTSYGEFLSSVNAIGTELFSNVSADGRILLVGEASVAWASAYFAIVCGGGTVIPLDAALSAADVVASARRTKACAVICSDRLKKELEATLLNGEELPSHATASNGAFRPLVYSFSELPSLAVLGRARIRNGNRSYLTAKIDAQKVSSILFESGSAAGGRLGVMLSQRNLCFSLAELCRMVELRSDDVLLSVLPLHLSHTLTCCLLAPLSCGAGVAFAEGLKRLTENMREIRPTVAVCPPVIPETMHRKISARLREIGLEKKSDALVKTTNSVPNERLRSTSKRHAFASVHESFGGRLRLLLSCGGAISPEALAGLRDFGIQTLQGYGRPECTALLALNRDRFFRDGTAGLPLPNTLVDLYGMQEDGVGEIRCKGSHVMLGYFESPSATAEVIRDGWFYTGEYGSFDADGFLHIVGKKKNVIRTADGQNVFPEELEALLCASPFVREAVVVGSLNPDRQENDVVALIYPDFDRLRHVYGENCTDAQILSELRRAVENVNSITAPHKRIRSLVLRRSEFPKTPSRRIIREGL